MGTTRSLFKLTTIIGGVLVLSLLLAIMLLQIAPGNLGFDSANKITLIELLGALLGVIGTLGGLTVGIIAIITLSQVQDQVVTEFDRRYEDHRKRLRDESNTWATAIRAWTHASMERELGKAQELMESTLKYWPDAPGARTEMARRLYRATEDAFLIDLIPQQRQTALTQYLSGEGGIPPVDSYLDDAAKWWAWAWDRERQDNEGTLAHIGSKIAALQRRPTDVLNYLRLWHRTGEMSARDCIVWASALMFEIDMTSLEAVLGEQIETPAKDVHAALPSVDDTFPGLVYWYAFPRGGNIERRAIVLGIVRHGLNGWDVAPYSEAGGRSETIYLESDENLCEYLAQSYRMIRRIPRWNYLDFWATGEEEE